MSFTHAHTVETTIDGQKLWLRVYTDESAHLDIDGRSFVIDPDSTEPQLEIKLSDNVRKWLETEITKGRAECWT